MRIYIAQFCVVSASNFNHARVSKRVTARARHAFFSCVLTFNRFNLSESVYRSLLKAHKILLENISFHYTDFCVSVLRYFQASARLDFFFLRSYSLIEFFLTDSHLFLICFIEYSLLYRSYRSLCSTSIWISIWIVGIIRQAGSRAVSACCG